MNREMLFAALRQNGDDIVLRTDTPEIMHLGMWLSSITDRRNELIIHRARDFGSTDNQLIITGQATVLDVPAVQVKAVFVLEGGEVDHFYLLMRLPSDWRLTHSFTDLPGSASGMSLLSDYHFVDPFLVLSARAQAITDAEYGLDSEMVENGLSLFASGLSDPLSLDRYGLSYFPAGAELARKPPEMIKAFITRTSGMTSVKLLCWWQATDGMKIGSVLIKRMGIGFQISAVAAPGTAPNVLWLWDVQIHANEQSFVVIASLPQAESEPPTYQALFQSAQFLNGGASSLTALTEGKDPSDILPFKDGPLLSLAAFTYTPDTLFGADFVLMDRQKRQPYVWVAIEDWLTIENVRLFLLTTLQPEVSFELVVRGIAEIEGYPFEVEVDLNSLTPGKVEAVRGALYKPHELDDVEALVTQWLGHEIGFPNLQLKLLSAEYSNDLSAKMVHYGAAVGGHIDLLGNGAFLLEAVGFEVDTADGHTTGKRMTGRVTIADVPIRVAADYLEGDGWTFEGRANPELEIHLGDLLDDLLHRADLSCPPGVPDLTLTEFGLSFGGKSKRFRLWGRATWKLPEEAELPWFEGEVETVVDLASAINPQSGSRELTADFLWLYTNGDLTFKASASHTHDGNAFFIIWDGGEEGETVGLHQLHDLLHLGDMFVLPDGEGWSIFDFSRLLVGYQNEPRLIQLQAASQLGNGELLIDAAFTKDSRSISGSWTGEDEGDSVAIDDLLDAVDLPTELSLPDSIGKELFDFHKVSMKYTSGMQSMLQFVGEAGDAAYKDIFLVMLKGASGWGFVSGIAFKDNTKLSEIPVIDDIPGLDTALEFIPIEPVYLLFSTTAANNFVPPVGDVGANSSFAMTPANPRQFGTAHTLTTTSAAIQRRYKIEADTATIAARIRLDKPGILSTIADLIKVKELDAQITIGSAFNLTALLPGQLEIPTGGSPLTLSNAFFGMGVNSTGVATFQLGGQTIFSLFGETRSVEARMIVNEEAAVATVHLQNIPLPPIHALPGVKFKEQDVYIEMGVQFEPPGMDMGFMGDFYIGDNPNNYTGKAIFVLEMVEGVPNPLYVQLTINKLTLWAMFEAMTGVMARIDQAETGLKQLEASGATGDLGASGAAHDTEGALEFLKQQYKNLQFVFDGVSLEDVAFHWADSIVILPDGTTAMPGVGFRGTLDIFGWHTYAAFEFSTGVPTTFSAHMEMEPINLQHVISVTGDGKGVLKSEAQGLAEAWEQWKDDGKTSKATALLKPKQNPPEYVIKPGGPVLIISSQHAPFLHANLHVAIFDIIHMDVRADVDETGLSFAVTTGVGSVITLTLGCKLRFKDGFRFEAYGKFGLHLKADLSFDLPLIGHIPINLDAGLDAELHMTVTDHDFLLSIDGSFEFEGVLLHMPTLTLTVPFPSFSDLPKQILSHIDNMAAEIFGELFGELGKLAGEAIKLVGEAVKAIGDEVVKIGEEAVKEVKVIGEAVEKAFGAAEDAVAAAATEIAKDAAKLLTEAADKAKEVLDDAVKVAEELGKDAALVLSTAAHGVIEIGKKIGEEVARIAHAIADIVNEAAHFVARIAEEIAHAVAEILADAEKAAEAVIHAAEVIADGVTEAAEAVWNEAEEIGNDIEEGLEDFGKGFLSLF